MELAIFSCVNLIAETAARAEVRTFHKNKELHGLEHYAWNVQPNINQNAMQLRRELFARALYFGEALLVEVNGQMLVAQSFQRVEHATAPDEFFGIVLRGDTAIKRRLTSDEVIYITTQNSEARAMLGELGALYGDILGRVFVIEAETIQATLPTTTETQNGRLLVRINGTTQEITLVTQAAASLPALQKEDINRGGTLYELELATYKISKTVITDLKATAHIITPHPKNTLLHVTKALQDAWNAAVQDIKALLDGSKKAHTATNAEAVPWDGITGKPGTFAPSAHNHDDRYYTESETNTKLNGKANSSHTHTKDQVGLSKVNNNAIGMGYDGNLWISFS